MLDPVAYPVNRTAAAVSGLDPDRDRGAEEGLLVCAIAGYTAR